MESDISDKYRFPQTLHKGSAKIPVLSPIFSGKVDICRSLIFARADEASFKVNPWWGNRSNNDQLALINMQITTKAASAGFLLAPFGFLDLFMKKVHLKKQ